MFENPFKGAIEPIKKKKKNKLIKRGKAKCDCGMFEIYPQYTHIPEWHLPECIMNRGK